MENWRYSSDYSHRSTSVCPGWVPTDMECQRRSRKTFEWTGSYVTRTRTATDLTWWNLEGIASQRGKMQNSARESVTVRYKSTL